jgi:hypothetical protein
LSIAWYGCWQAWPHATLVVAALAWISAFVGMIAKLDQEDE